MSSSIPLLLWALLLLSGANCQTTPAIQRIFLGRCSYFKQFGLNKPNIDCTKAYNVFLSAFAFKDPCNITMAAYDEYFNLTKQVLPRDKTLLWSGTEQLKSMYCFQGANCYANDQFLASYIPNKMSWCGSKTDPSGMNFTGCRTYDPTTCPNHVTHSFWAAASAQIASGSTGLVQLLLNGTRTTGSAYSRTSFFGLYELPNLDPKKVNPLGALVALTPGKPVKENCNNGSLTLLRTDATAKGLNYTCATNPPRVRHLSCAFFAPTVEPNECKFEVTSSYSFANNTGPPSRFSYVRS
ncbi:ADP-ribosyl cyclase/cyclic ADP-ribose hydrolase-like isoform X3 [Oscarella lobularis]|uniref:ADP-ribosyl cyclase/cyclic ADP-ribose hydrolase-like isoform X3 n=1 Tax=Oscarella lobularis TaxID=121494 RepID=UPI003314130F